MARFVCPLCVTPQFSTLSKLLRHIRVTHADANSFSIQCTLQGCCRTFRSFKSYQSHIYSHHNTVQSLHLEQSDVPAFENESDDLYSVCSDSEEIEKDAECDSTPGENSVVKSPALVFITCVYYTFTQLQRAAATWILKTRECHRIPFSVMTSIIDDVQSLYKVALAHISDRVQRTLCNSGVDSAIQRSVAAELSDGPYTQVFHGLTTTAQQLTYFKQHFNFVVSSI